MWGILIAVFMIGLLVFVHEFGHYAMARLLKVEVKELAVGFGRRLWRYVSPRSGIAYTLRLLPFGGFTEFLSEDDVGRHAGRLLPFEEHAVWKRMLIILAGPALNLLLALALSTGLWYVEEVVTHYTASAEAAGLQYLTEYGTAADGEAGYVLQGDEQTYDPAPTNIFLLGVEGFGEVISYATESPGNALETIGGWLTAILAIGDIIMEEGVYGALVMMIGCSISMGLFNLIPIPGLDGSQLMMLVLELVRGRKLSAFWQNVYEWTCLGAVGALLLCMGINDVITVVKLVFPAG